MYKILTGLFLLVLVSNPLTAQIIQPEVFRAWDWVIVNTGWIVTLTFCLYLTALMGYLLAKYQLKDRKAQANKIAKAKKSKRNLDGMKYEIS
jgi:heme/copper-type cytochrome/quinol oxidase subunit 2